MTRLLSLLSLPLLLACGSVEKPSLCVFNAENAEPSTLSAKDCQARSFTAGEAIYIVHELHPSAQVDDEVTITVASACEGSAAKSQHAFEGNKVLFSTVAPPGSECGLEVTASLLNETNRYVSTHPAGTCTPVCPKNAGSGGDSGTN